METPILDKAIKDLDISRDYAHSEHGKTSMAYQVWDVQVKILERTRSQAASWGVVTEIEALRAMERRLITTEASTMGMERAKAAIQLAAVRDLLDKLAW